MCQEVEYKDRVVDPSLGMQHFDDQAAVGGVPLMGSQLTPDGGRSGCAPLSLTLDKATARPLRCGRLATPTMYPPSM